MAKLDLAKYFETGSLIKTLRKRHPYDFVETYELLRHLYGYDKFYVNLGYWKDGLDTVEAGYELVRLLADELGLAAGATLLDAGAGMGQAAVDLAVAYDLRKVTGININPRQVRFACALRDAHGLAGVVEHICGDAAEVSHTLAPGTYDAALAVECIGHFPSAAHFLAGARAALVDGGRLAFCLNIANVRPSLWQRVMMKTAYGFVPDSAAVWSERIAAASFRVVAHRDITDQVLVPAMTRSLRELDASSPATARLSRTRKSFMRRGCQSLLDAARSERMSYQYFVIEKAA